MSNLRTLLEEYVQDIQTILRENTTDEEIINAAKQKWFDWEHPEQADIRLSIFVSPMRRLSISPEDTHGIEVGDKINEIPQPENNPPPSEKTSKEK